MDKQTEQDYARKWIVEARTAIADDEYHNRIMGWNILAAGRNHNIPSHILLAIYELGRYDAREEVSDRLEKALGQIID